MRGSLWSEWAYLQGGRISTFADQLRLVDDPIHSLVSAQAGSSCRF